MVSKVKPDLTVTIGGIRWNNPVTTAAGTFIENEYYDPSALGAITTKGVASEPWQGNPVPRIAESSSGMLNSVGLENKGVDWYIENELRALKKTGSTVIANVVGHSEDEYVSVVEKLNESDVDMFEINISCPNVKEGGIAFGTDPVCASTLTKRVKKVAEKPVIVKLSPNVTDIVTVAEAVEDAGADAISMINTLLGIAIDIDSGKCILANKTGGLSGPAIKPVALRMVYQVAGEVEIPIIGMGGITTGEDAIEFFMAGASAVAIGTAALVDPMAPTRIVGDIDAWMAQHGYSAIEQLKEVRNEL